MAITIDVTQEDIDQGIEGECLRCPIAKAASRAGLNAPSVDNLSIHYGPMKDRQREELPPIARGFIRRFDSCGRVEPFSFQINGGSGDGE